MRRFELLGETNQVLIMSHSSSGTSHSAESMEQHFFKCHTCGAIVRSTSELSAHYRHFHDPLKVYVCGQGNCSEQFRFKTSMIRHITSQHSGSLSTATEVTKTSQVQVAASTLSFVPDPISSVHQLNPECNADDVNDDDEDLAPTGDPLSIEEELRKIAVKTLLELRSTSSLTGKSIERFEHGCYKMLSSFASNVCSRMWKSLVDKGMSEDDIREVLKDIKDIKDPFEKLRTIDEQLQYFSENYGLVIPESKFLGTRLDQRLDSKTNTFVQSQVNDTFQFVSIIKTLKNILSNKKTRRNIFKDRISMDGVIRSYVDGAKFKDHPFLQRHGNVLHILLYYDELEIANSLGSKTIIHKLGAFFFQILNLPPEESSKLSSIFLIALVYADDMKKEGYLAKALEPFIQEMKKLASESGVQIELDGEPFTLRAILVAFTADNLAAHEVLGFLSTGARHFCRKCMVSRQEIRLCANALGEIRTKEMHANHLASIAVNPRFSSQCGVKRSCPLDKVPYFHCVENNVFDSFHELLEGVVPLVIKCVLGHYFRNKLFTSSSFNAKVASFSYGIPDAKNKPSPVFTDEMFTGGAKLHQSGSHIWCLIRTLPFLIYDFVKENDEYLELVFLLQDALQIIFAFEVRNEDLDRLDTLLCKHNELFQKLFIDSNRGENMVVVDDPPNEMPLEDQEENVDDPEVMVDHSEDAANISRKKKPWKVYVTNKLHQIKHLPEMMRDFGPAVRLWCAKFEGRLKIFRMHSHICCNFINPPKTMAAMFQLSTLKSIITEYDDFPVEYRQYGPPIKVSDSIHSQLLLQAGEVADEIVAYANGATLYGEDYRKGLFVSLPTSTILRPCFGMIKDVIVCKKTLYVLTQSWKNIGLNQRVNAFQVIPPEDFSSSELYNVKKLPNYRCIAPWTIGLSDVYLSVRTIMM
ncbi:Zinc finger protein 75A [Frankliniella fusca]|uniref:Zinc finger protein 75A n=1 Tax=Frankliniella fusca TaxID=407009 RepID=A0AAE1LI25_9NEOP|nr:Zinc finger protein 75A [Frankliniella fusca]